jgi:hypothetical protein
MLQATTQRGVIISLLPWRRKGIWQEARLPRFDKDIRWVGGSYAGGIEEKKHLSRDWNIFM